MNRTKRDIAIISVASFFYASISCICFSEMVAVMETTSKTKLILDMPSDWSIIHTGHAWERPDLVTVTLKNSKIMKAHIGYQGAAVAPDIMHNSMNSIWNRDIPEKTSLVGITGSVFNCYYYSIPIDTNGLWSMSGFATIESQYFNMTCVYTNTQDLDSFIQIFRSGRIEQFNQHEFQHAPPEGRGEAPRP